jgi:hypothetical protein
MPCRASRPVGVGQLQGIESRGMEGPRDLEVLEKPVSHISYAPVP